MKRKILWGVMASFMIIAIALMTIMLIRMAQMTVPGASCVSPSGPYYDGLYIDLVQEADYQSYLDNRDSAADSHIIKISNDTGYLACALASSGDLEIVYPKFVHEGSPVELRFENRVLTGYRLMREKHRVCSEPVSRQHSQKMIRLPLKMWRLSWLGVTKLG